MQQAPYLETTETPLQLVTTVGPASFGHEPALISAGATALRLNASHLSPDEVFEHCERICHHSPQATCIVDLQGAKMRLSSITNFPVLRGDTVRFSCDPGESTALYVPHPELFEQTSIGETLSLDDGRLELEVTDHQPGVLVARANQDFVIKSRKGINRRSHPVEIQDLGFADQTILAKCKHLLRVKYAISFVKNGCESDWVRKRVAHASVTLKIERQEALDSLDKIADAADALWICRGDLGAQLGLLSLGQAVARIDPLRHRAPLLMAGQVLEHLTAHDEPTRSEICHMHDVLQRGYAGIVLSDETAIGRHPVHATTWAQRLLQRALP